MNFIAKVMDQFRNYQDYLISNYKMYLDLCCHKTHTCPKPMASIDLSN